MNEIVVEDRYSDKIFRCHKSTIFMVGKTIATIRKSNSSCVDIRDENGKLLSWWCLEYVLKNPKIFIPILVCQDIGKKQKIGITHKPFEIVSVTTLA